MTLESNPERIGCRGSYRDALLATSRLLEGWIYLQQIMSMLMRTDAAPNKVGCRWSIPQAGEKAESLISEPMVPMVFMAADK